MKSIVTTPDIEAILEEVIFDEEYVCPDPFKDWTLDDFKTVLNIIQTGIFCGLTTPSEWFDNTERFSHLLGGDRTKVVNCLYESWGKFLDGCFRGPEDSDQPLPLEELFLRMDAFSDYMTMCVRPLQWYSNGVNWQSGKAQIDQGQKARDVFGYKDFLPFDAKHAPEGVEG